MTELHDDLTAIAEQVRLSTTVASPSALRARSDRRRQHRTVAAAGLAVVVALGGAGYFVRSGQAAPPAAPSVAPSPSTTAAATVLDGGRLTRIVVAGTGGRVLAIGSDDDDRILATKVADLTGDGSWLLRRQGSRYQIVSGRRHGSSEVCMTVVHDKSPGTVRDRVCDPTAPAQLFTIKKESDGNYSIANAGHYLQVVDGPFTLVPDLPESLTTTYELSDHGSPQPQKS